MTADAHATSDAHARPSTRTTATPRLRGPPSTIIIVALRHRRRRACSSGNWLLFWVGGVGLCILGVVVGKVMSMMGMGQRHRRRRAPTARRRTRRRVRGLARPEHRR